MNATITQLLQQLISCESTQNMPNEIAKTADVFSRFFGNLVSRHDQPKSKTLATLFVPKGIAMPNVLFLGHMDVVPASSNLFLLRQRGDRLYGRGTYDMKGPTAALAVAMRNTLKKHPRASVGLLITGDEESGGIHGTGNWVKQHTRRLPKAVFNPDGGNAFSLVNQEKGVMFIEVCVSGKAGHAAQPWEGQNALERAASGIITLKEKFPASKHASAWKTSAVPTILRSGTAGNQIPDSATIHIDIRYIPVDRQKDILRRVQTCFPYARVRVLKQAEPFFLPTDAAAVKHLQSCAKDIFGKRLPLERYHSSCDARFFAAHNVPVILMRPPGGGAHATNEWVSLRGLEKYCGLAEHFINTFVG